MILCGTFCKLTGSGEFIWAYSGVLKIPHSKEGSFIIDAPVSSIFTNFLEPVSKYEDD